MTVVDATLIVLAISFLAGMVRAGIGPSLADRAAATDVCLFCVVAALAVLAVRLDEPIFLDAVIVATLLGFVATISLARLIRRRP